MGLLRITAKYRYLSDVMQNIYNFETTEPVSTLNLNSVLDNWTTDILPEILAIQSSGVEYLEFVVEDLEDPLGNYYVEGGDQRGGDTGQRWPGFIAWSFKGVVANRTTRPAGRRISGLTENMVEGNGNPDPTYTAKLNNAKDAMGLEISLSPLGTAYPCVVGYNPFVPGQPQTIRAVQRVLSWTFPMISSQNSRKKRRS